MPTPLTTGLDMIIKQKVGEVNTPLYPITKTANVKDSTGNDLDTILATLALDADVVKKTQLGVATVMDGETVVSTGVATLDTNGKVPASQLPSYVDDVIEGYMNDGTFYKTKTPGAEEGDPATYSDAVTPESDKIYVDVDTNVSYRWGGSVYVAIASSLTLGETENTAYRGDRGKIAYDHSQAAHARTDATATAGSATNGYIEINGTDTLVYSHPAAPTGTAQASAGLFKVTIDADGHITSSAAVAKADITALGIPAQDTTYDTMVASEDGTWVTPPDTTYNNATTTDAGLMSASDKTKLDNTTSVAAGSTTPAFDNGIWFDIQE